MSEFLNIKTIHQLHELLGYQKPKHTLVTLIDYSKLPKNASHYDVKIVTDFYIISLKTPAPKSVQYGRQYYDFEEGSMMFMAPGQVFSVAQFNDNIIHKGWGLYFHPDLIASTVLASKIKAFNFFSYNVNEALHLSEKEIITLSNITETIRSEYDESIDKFSNSVIVSAIEQILNYAQRYYARQFITRFKVNTDLVSKFEHLVFQYFNSEELSEKGIPRAEYFANQLNLSAGYLNDLLKKETGKTMKEFLQLELIEKAKYKLLNSNNTVSEIAYSLGFEYPQYFNRLFKAKTGCTPIEFRKGN
jgi:AraC family transcriptional regulator, transcriptional activator of pobA